MPRAKNSKLGTSSLLHGSTFDQKTSRYMTVVQNDLEQFLGGSLALERAATDRICRKVDMWYHNILHTVPMEVLLEPFKPEDRERLKLPDLPSIPLAPTVASGSSDRASTPSVNPSLPSAETHSTASQTRRRVAVAASTKSKRAAGKKKLSPPGSGSVKAGKASTAGRSFHTPLATTRSAGGGRPIVTPKFDIRKPPPVIPRPARTGEILLSLSGSPIASKPAGVIRPVHVHVNGGQVVKVKADPGSDESVKKLCRGIEKYCGVK